MAFHLSKKKASSVNAFAYLLFLLMIISLITSRDRNRLIDPPDAGKTDGHVANPAGFTCDRSHFRYDICFINGSAVLDPTTATLYSVGVGPTSYTDKIKPYPRKYEIIMDQIRNITVQSSPVGPTCRVPHNSPAVVFSAGGNTRNFFHSFIDGFLPLYITLNSLSFADRDVTLVVDQAEDWWVHKFADLIRAFTKYPVVNLAKETSTHCFTRAAVGLVTHGVMVVDPKARPGPLTMSGFHSFVRNAYSRGLAVPKGRRRPNLVWVVRTGSEGRVILNQDEARAVAEEIGFDVSMYEPTDSFSLRDAYELVDKSHAMIGAHGAGLTHSLFLRPGSVVVQITPLGLSWLGEMCFGRLARESGMEYMEYKVGYEESSLSTKFAKDDPVLKDARMWIEEKGWVQDLMDVYLKDQNLELDLVRFRSHMENVYERATHFMELHG